MKANGKKVHAVEEKSEEKIGKKNTWWVEEDTPIEGAKPRSKGEENCREREREGNLVTNIWM